ncbi:MAG TPA: alkaline phosphatase PhoX, partial [Bacteroidia bacterium]
DDAAVVYVNGVEVLRQNIDTGKLNNRSISQTIVDGTNETTYFTSTISKSFFKNGINQIAVAIHQRDSVSSDLGFDMEIVPKLKPNPVAMGCVDGDKHIACFNSIAPTAQVNNLIIPKASHNFQQLLKQGTPYTLISGNVPGNPDFTAYVPRNGSSVDGVVAINHENSPGGVSLAYVRYIDSTQLWTIDSTKRVDLYNNDLVSTVRNCSGGITPWGTVITSEESVSSADANADGYFDIGWNVEFNPWTGKVMEYGNGKQEKLWGLGRMNHENVVVAKDSMTVYQGEDGGTHLVYKFVADKKMDLSKGKLYVLKLNQALVSGEPTGTTGRWIPVPNTTQADRNNCSSLALSVGGTQFNGVEDVEIGTVDGKIYFTAKGLNRVYRFKDADSTFTEFETFVGGKSYAINTGTSNVMEPWGSGNDNLTFDDKGNLWVLQDGSRNYMWLVRPDHTQAEPKIELFMSPSLSAEPTGMTFTPDYKFMFMSIQHPSSSNIAQIDASGNSIDFKSAATIVVSRKEYLGIMAPEADFVADAFRTRVGNSINFEDISYPKITGRIWNFKGAVDTFSSSAKPMVTYSKPGKYEVTLIASNKKGSDTLVRKNYIEVIPGLPVAEFTADKVSVFEGETVRLSDLSTGLVEFRNWKLNGSIINTSDSSFNLKLNEMGNYSIELFVGNYGDTVKKLKTSYITVKRRKPIADFSISKTIVSLNDKVKLVDLSLNKIESRKWSAPSSIGLTSTTDSVVELSYNKVGTYDVYLVVANAGGSDTLEKLKSIKVLPFVPKADFKVSANTIPRGDTIVLTDLSTNGIDQRKWTVQGATFIGNSSDSVVKVKFMSAGVYSVKLWVSNEAGKDSLLKQAHITVGPLRPTADFTASQTTITRNNSIVFSDLSTENISKRTWSFSGGVPSSGSDSNESVSYPVTGKYNVQLTVSNASGSKTILKSAYVTVNPSTGIESLKDLANLSIYPNPVVNNVNLELELFETTKVSVELTDISGKTLKVFIDKESHNGMQTLSFNVDDLNLMPGVYVLKIKIGDEVISRKIVKS